MLLHCVGLASSKLIISTPDLAPFAAHAAGRLAEGAATTVSLNIGSFSKATPLPSNALEFPFLDPATVGPAMRPQRSISDVGALIYTSGTTGKPKACTIKNSRVCTVCLPSSADQSNPSKYLPARMYSCMPLVHGMTFFTAMCSSVGTSGCFCLGRKFSPRNFWKDVTESRSTRILYVGDLCRFLTRTQLGTCESLHSLVRG